MSTGIAVITQRVDGSCLATATAITSKGRRADLLPARSQRIRILAEEILYAVGDAQLLVLEGASYGSIGGSALDRQGVWWAVVHGLVERGIPVAVCAPKTRAKWATGNGTADKAAVAVAMARIWPHVALDDSDSCDALAMATMGAQRLAWPIPALRRHIESLAAVAWPEGLPPLPAAA